MFRQEIEDGRQVEQPDNWLPPARPLGGGPPRGDGPRVRIALRRPDARRRDRSAVAGRADGPARHPLRPAGRRLRRPDDQHAAALGGRGTRRLRFRASSAAATSSAPSIRRSRPRPLTRVLYPDDSTPRRPGPALRPGVLPGLLLAGRHRAPVPPAGQRLVRAARQGGHPAQRHPPRAGRRRADADPAGRGRARLGPGLGPDRSGRWPTPTTRCSPRRWRSGRSALRADRPPAPGDHLRDQSPVPRRRPRPLPRRRPAACRRDEPDRGGHRKQVRMANLAIVGSHSTNGVAAIHSDLLRTTRRARTSPSMFPERFNNKTNGVTPRRWLLLANPDLAALITEAIGDGWITDLAELARLAPLADDAGFRDALPRRPSARPRLRFADWLKAPAGPGRRSRHDLRQPDQAHPRVQAATAQRPAHRRALQPAARRSRARRPAADVLLRRQGGAGVPPGQADHQADQQRGRAPSTPIPAVRGRIKVLFLPDYNVSLAERLIPASDVSEQISTAGYEASGTSNMKFMMNGALTIGTRDGATIEMAEEAGEENFFLFGLTAEQVAGSRGWYSPLWHYDHEPETARRPRPHRLRRLQPGRARHLHADPRHPADQRRSLHAPGRPHLLRRRPRSRSADLYRQPDELGPQGDPQRRLLGQVLQRPHDRRVRRRDLERHPHPGGGPGRRAEGGTHESMNRRPGAIAANVRSSLVAPGVATRDATGSDSGSRRCGQTREESVGISLPTGYDHRESCAAIAHGFVRRRSIGEEESPTIHIDSGRGSALGKPRPRATGFERGPSFGPTPRDGQGSAPGDRDHSRSGRRRVSFPSPAFSPFRCRP